MRHRFEWRPLGKLAVSVSAAVALTALLVGAGASGAMSERTTVQAERSAPVVIQVHSRSATRRDLQVRIGGWNVMRAGSLAGAIRTFGRPSACRLPFVNFAVATWGRIGLTGHFGSYGPLPSPDETACSAPRYVKLDRARCDSPRCVTIEGLSPGDSVATLRRLYPDAERHGRVYWLVTTPSIVGDRHIEPVLFATAGRDAVRSLTVVVRLAGD